MGNNTDFRINNRTPQGTANNDPEMSEVLKTLRILSSASISRRQMLQSQSQNLTLGIKCINCNGVRITQQHSGCRSRTEILKDLDKLEETMKLKGQSLPDWVQAYKNGDTVTAAKLLHVDYTKQMKAYTLSNSASNSNQIGNNHTNLNNKRRVEVQIAAASSTTTNFEPASSSIMEVHKKQRLVSSSTFGDSCGNDD